MTGHQSLSLQWAFSQHNEHRLFIQKLILGTLYRAIPDFRVGLYLNAGLLSTASASMILLARRLRGWTSVTDAVLPLSILNLGQSESFLLGLALTLILPAWISYELIVAMCRTSQSPGWWPSLVVGGLLVLLPLSGGSGLVMLPPLMLWLAGYVACGWWSGRDPGAWGRALGLGLLLTTLGVVAFYLKGYERPAYHPATPSAWAACSTTLEFLSLVIRPVGGGWGWRPRVIVALLAAIALIRLAIITRRSPAARPRVWPDRGTVVAARGRRSGGCLAARRGRRAVGRRHAHTSGDRRPAFAGRAAARVRPDRGTVVAARGRRSGGCLAVGVRPGCWAE